MRVSVHPDSVFADAAAADLLVTWLTAPGVRSVMLPGGNTPLELYRLVAARRPSLGHLQVFALDEYVGVPLDEPRNCANLIRGAAVEPWGIPAGQYFWVSSAEAEAGASVEALERRIAEAGGLDVAILGLGQNGHLGFNEPGSAVDSPGRVVELESLSVEANRRWFGGDYAPCRGVTTGLKILLAARRVLVLAYGSPKVRAVRAMVEGPRGVECPASLLQGHPCCHLFLDAPAAAGLSGRAQ